MKYRQAKKLIKKGGSFKVSVSFNTEKKTIDSHVKIKNIPLAAWRAFGRHIFRKVRRLAKTRGISVALAYADRVKGVTASVQVTS